MAPNSDIVKPIQYCHRNYPNTRKGQIPPHDWLEQRRMCDNAEGLWRVHDDLYDLTEWLDKHPGGADWLQTTKGTDITEAFESHHLTSLPQRILDQYHTRHVDTLRNSTFTFKEDGFYRTLKIKVSEEIKNVPKDFAMRSKWTLDVLIFFTFLFSVISVITRSWLIMAAAIMVAGLCLAWTVNAAHNFFHQKDSWRMYAYNLSLLTVRDARVSHILSHHLYPNTLFDLEITTFDPFLQWLPLNKGVFRYLWWGVSPLMYALIFFGQFVVNLIHLLKTRQFFAQVLIPFLLPAAMYLFGTAGVLITLLSWVFILVVASFLFGFIGLNAAHHHPNIYHEGDAIREDRDWGKYQLDAVMDRHIVTGSRFLALTHYGDHALHHLFPTIDHSILPFLYPVVNEVCEQFGMKLRFISIMEMIIGQFKQLTRTTVNPIPPDAVAE